MRDKTEALYIESHTAHIYLWWEKVGPLFKEDIGNAKLALSLESNT